MQLRYGSINYIFIYLFDIQLATRTLMLVMNALPAHKTHQIRTETVNGRLQLKSNGKDL